MTRVASSCAAACFSRPSATIETSNHIPTSLTREYIGAILGDLIKHGTGGCQQKWTHLGSQQLEAVAAELQIDSINVSARFSGDSCVGKFVRIAMEKPSSVKTPLKDVLDVVWPVCHT